MSKFVCWYNTTTGRRNGASNKSYQDCSVDIIEHCIRTSSDHSHHGECSLHMYSIQSEVVCTEGEKMRIHCSQHNIILHMTTVSETHQYTLIVTERSQLSIQTPKKQKALKCKPSALTRDWPRPRMQICSIHGSRVRSAMCTCSYVISHVIACKFS